MPEPRREDIELASHAVKESRSETFRMLSWFYHHTGQIAKGTAALFGLAVLGGVGYFTKDAFSGAKKTSIATSSFDETVEGERSLTAKEPESVLAKSEDLAAFDAETKTSVLQGDMVNDDSSPKIADGEVDFCNGVNIAKDAATKSFTTKHHEVGCSESTEKIEEIASSGVNRSSRKSSATSSQPLVGAIAVDNLVVNGSIPDLLLEVGRPWEGLINMTELFGKEVNVTGFSQMGNQPLPDWLQAAPQQTGPGITGFEADGITIKGNLVYIAALYEGGGLKIIDISNSTNPILMGSVSGSNAIGVVVSGNFAYVAAWEGLKIVDISNSTYPILKGSMSGFSAGGLTVSGNLVYLVGYEGLKIIDISNNTNPTLKGGVPGFIAFGVTVRENFAYVVAHYGKGLKIIDISNSTDPFLVGPGIGMPGMNARDVAINGNLAYVAVSQGLKIIDISNSTHPILKDSMSGFYARGIVLNGNFAYIASYQGLQIVNINNRTNPLLIGSGVSGFHASKVTVSGNLAYVATDDGLKIIDLSQWRLSGAPTKSKCLYQFAISAENLRGNATKIFNVRTDHFPYVIGTIPNQSLKPGSALSLNIKMTDIFNDPDKGDTLFFSINPRPTWLQFTIEPFFMAKKTNFYGVAAGVAVRGNLAYVGVTDWSGSVDGGLRIIDIGNSTNPFLVGHGVTGFEAVGRVTISDDGNLAYVAADDGLKIIDISNSTNPFITGEIKPGFESDEVAISGHLAYVATRQGLQIIDISDSAHPALIKPGVPGFYANGVTVRVNLAYVAARDQGLKIIDISNSSNPFLVGPGMLGFNARSITVLGNLAYVTTGYPQGLKIIDISNDTNPVLMGDVPGFTANGVTVSENLAYVATSNGLKIIDASQPNKPTIVGEISDTTGADVAVLPANTVCVVGDSFSILDTTNYKFSGTPTDSDAGNYPITVTGTDLDGAQAQTSFTIRVEGGPRLNHPIPPQIALVGQSANFFLDQGTFSDPNKDVITYEAMLGHNQTLPYFLRFNPSSATFSGIPTLYDKGNYLITIFASDRIVYPPTPANFTLVVQDPIADQTFIVDRNASSTLPIPPDTTFEGRSLVYDVKPRNSKLLPDWLHFDAANRKLFGTPNITDVGAISIQVTLNDGYGEAFSLFTLNVEIDTPPILASMVPVQNAYAEKLFQYVLPKDTFTDANGDTLRYSASLGDAGNWLKFNSEKREFVGTPSGWSDAYPYVTRKYTITVTATDPSNAAASSTFELNLNGPSSWQTLITTSIVVLGALATAYGYTHKKYLLWDFFMKGEYRKPLELLEIGNTGFSHKIGFPAEDIKSIVVTLSSDRSCAKKMSPCLKKTFGFFSSVTTDIRERVFLCSGVSAYFFPWLFYDSKANTLRSVEGGPTEEFVGKDIKIQVRRTDNRIMEEFHIKIGGQIKIADETVTVREPKPSTARYKRFEEPLISPVAGNR